MKPLIPSVIFAAGLSVGGVAGKISTPTPTQEVQRIVYLPQQKRIDVSVITRQGDLRATRATHYALDGKLDKEVQAARDALDALGRKAMAEKP